LQFCFGGIVTSFATIAEALYAERKLYDDRFSGTFSAFKFKLEDGDIGIKNKKFQYFYDVNPSVLSHSMNNIVNFMKHLTCIIIV
jgi:hypothetical protein